MSPIAYVNNSIPSSIEVKDRSKEILKYKRYIFSFKNLILLSEMEDTVISPDLFVRKINNINVIIYRNKVSLIEISKSLNPIDSRGVYGIDGELESLMGERNTNYGTFDTETFEDPNGHNLAKVYALGFLTNKDKNSNMFYLTNFKNSEELILTCINNMLNIKYHQYIFYCHNFGNFDLIFIYSVLEQYNFSLIEQNKEIYYQITPLMRDDQVIRLDIKIKYLNDKYIKISFVDSINILNGSLANLAKNFKVDHQKGIFPYSFVSKNTLEYVGNTPNISYYNNIKTEDYKLLIKKD
jgi:hypothetical protein